MEHDGERESGEGLGLRGDQCFVIRSSVYFFSAPVLLPSSPPHHPDRYSASTKVWKKAYGHVSQSTLIKLKAMEFEISQSAVGVPVPFVWLFRHSVAQDVECIHLKFFTKINTIYVICFSYYKFYKLQVFLKKKYIGMYSVMYCTHKRDNNKTF